MSSEAQPPVAGSSPEGGHAVRGVRRVAAILRSTFYWTCAAAYFFPVCTALVLVAVFVDPRKNDRAQRMLMRTTVKMAGIKLEIRQSQGFDAARTCFLIANHVNLFDPMVLYSAVPQFFRGLELESHFRIPVYGWMMKRFGNVPVPDENRPSELKRMWRLTRAALDDGVSLLVFPEGQRTEDGRVGEFKDGVFRMAIQFGAPIVPVSTIGAYEFHQKSGWMLRPGKVVVWLHDVIETSSLSKEDVPALRDRVRQIIANSLETRRGLLE